MSTSLITDFQGKLIPKNKARRIKDENGVSHYYEENVSCILMPDGTWYRTTTGKIVYDWSLKAWVFAKDFTGSKGLVEDGLIGLYSKFNDEVTIFVKKDTFVKKTVFDPFSKNFETLSITEKRWNKLKAINAEVAKIHNFMESINDGSFYKVEDCDDRDLEKMNTPGIPQGERSNIYSLDDDKEYRSFLEECYDNNHIKPCRDLALFAKRYIPFTYGVEIEVQNGFVPKRIREPLGFRTCRDGSLDTGQEYVSVPMEDGKGLETIKEMCIELSKRCVISNKCSVHIHFGNVRTDKLYVISLWKTFSLIQEELRKFFPYSRTNSIREDGKVYAAMLPDVSLNTKSLMKLKTDSEFRSAVNVEFQKIYTWLNAGHPMGEVYDEEFVKESRTQIIHGREQKQHCYRVKKHAYTTKLPRHAVQGRKWDKKQRYLALNILNLFFSHSKTAEFRVHEATTNFDKILMYMCLNVAILKYAENFEKVMNATSLNIVDILTDHFPKKISDEIFSYFHKRRELFCTVNGTFKSAWKNIEENWLEADKKYRTDKKIYQL